MVGLDKFKEAFAEFLENYVIIGGTACDIAMTVIVEDNSVSAPSSVVQCVREFVAAIRSDYDNLAPALANALDAEPELVGQLLEQLKILFVEE